MLEGSLWDKILIVALPFAFTGIMQQLFNAADIAMLGQFVGKEAMAAVGSNSPIIAMVLSLFIGVSLGANVVIARFIGKKNIHGVHAAVHTAILVALGSGVVMTILGEIAAAPLLRALSVPDEIFDMSVLYLRIFLLGMPVILLYNFESSIFRSQGDTRTPLYCLIVSGVVKFFLNLFFILVLDMSVEGGGHRHGRCQHDQLGTALLFPVPQHDGYPRPSAGFPRR
ncbi:MATE family efflux transporter [Megasphaera stantonii]|uniref:MATE family efflux transporter n=1 Tax=Megasphaera stantonii TaxID=2144175 RepID=UPI001EF406D0|nr:MATE family efflux transporter [Megasphaera stantonii]